MTGKGGRYLGPTLDSTWGVKQGGGDPLSLLLLSLCIHRVECGLRDRGSLAGTTLGQQLVYVMLQSDDLTLLGVVAESPTHLSSVAAWHGRQQHCQ